MSEYCLQQVYVHNIAVLFKHSLLVCTGNESCLLLALINNNSWI